MQALVTIFMFEYVIVRVVQGPKGLRAESARAVTGRWCPHSGKGEDFLTGQPVFLTKTAVSLEFKVKNSFPRSEINGHADG